MAGFSEFLSSLPQILQVVQIFGYIVIILFFGSIAIKGYRGYVNRILRFLGRIGLGFVCLVSGVVVSAHLPLEFLNEGLYRMFQLNLLIGGIMSSIILALLVYMITFRLHNVSAMEKRIKKLEERVKKAKDMEKKGKSKIKNPVSIIGIVLIVLFLVFSFMSFRGFPSFSDDISVLMGGSGDLPEGCASTLMIVATNLEAFSNQELPEYDDPNVKALLEEGSGYNMSMVYRVEYNQDTYAIGITPAGKMCSARPTQFCECIDVSEMIG